MNEHISTSSHSYIISYGMSREPFGDKIEDDLFYAEPSRKQKLDILLHLTQYGNELMLVTGPYGSGKTTLLQQFQLHALDTWKVARIEAKNGIDERKLVQQLFHQMNLEFHGATHAELLEHLEHHFDSLQYSARQAVMLIDDANQLPVTALKSVLMLAGLTNKDNKPLLRIILFGNDKLEENFSNPFLAQHSNVVRRVVDLPAFDNEHTAHYILHRLSAAGFVDNKPFTDSAMQKIYKQSNGWPGKINHFAHNLLVESAPTVAPNTQNNKSTFNIPRAIAAAIGITTISALLFFQDDFNAWINDDTNNNSSADQQSPTTQPLEIPPKDQLDAVNTTNSPATKDSTVLDAPQSLPADDPAAILTQMYGEKTPSDEMNEEMRAIDAITDNSDIDSSDSKPPTEAVSQPVNTKGGSTLEPSTESAASPSAVEPAANTAIEPAHPAVAVRKETAPTGATSPPQSVPKTLSRDIPTDLPGHRADWILKLNPEHYTLQLVAGNNIKTLHHFIQQHTLTAPLAVYQSTRKGKPWFGLIHGTFPNKEQAINASGRLNKALRRVKPWVRKLAPLQKELQETTLARQPSK